MTKFIDLTEDQIKAIDWFMNNPPKYYKWFYKVYKKVLNYAIFLSLVTCMILAIIQTFSNIEIFNVIKYIFFFVSGIGLWALVSYLYKHFYTKRYAKKIGLTLKEWNLFIIGQRWDI